MDALGVAVASGAGYFVGDGVVFGDGEGGAFAVAGVAVALGVDYVDGGGCAGGILSRYRVLSFMLGITAWTGINSRTPTAGSPRNNPLRRV